MSLSCPLCKSTNFFSLRSFKIENLRAEWQHSFGFDPFSKVMSNDTELTCYRCKICSLEFYPAEFAGDAQFYDRLSRSFKWYYESEKWEFYEAIRRLALRPELNTLLEFGCGDGAFLAKVASAYRVKGVEINPHALTTCQERLLDVTSQELHELVGQKFDIAVSFQVLEHLTHPGKFLEQLIALLIPGSTLILAVPNPESYMREFDHMLLNMPPHHISCWGTKTFEWVAQEFELDLIEIAYEPLKFDHYLQYLQMLESRLAGFETPEGLSQRLKKKLRDFLRFVVRQTLIPFAYQYHKANLLGQLN